MTIIKRYRVALTNFPGGPGVMTFYGTETSTLLTPISNLLGSIALRVPTSMHLQVEPEGDLLQDTNGEVTGTWATTTQPDHVGADPATYPAPCGMVLGWLTDTIAHGRRLKGRSYVVPLGGGSYQADGTINPTNRDQMITAVATFVGQAAGEAVVWHRPRKARPADGSRPAIVARDGASGLITGATVPDKVAVLRSRRP